MKIIQIPDSIFDQLQVMAEAANSTLSETLANLVEAPLYRTIVENMQHAVVIYQDGRPVFCNEAMARLNGYTVEEYLALDREAIDDNIHPDDRELVWRSYQARVQGHTAPSTYEFRGRRKDGSYYWISTTNSAITFNGRRASLAVVTDITQRKRAEDAYHAIVEGSLQGVLIIQDGRPVFVNQALLAMSGYTTEEYLRLSVQEFRDLIHPDDRAMVWERYERRIAGEEVTEHFECRLLRKDGSVWWAEVRSGLVEFQGRPAVQSTILDITDRRETEEAYQALVDHSPDGLIIVQDERPVFANQVAVAQTGYSRDEYFDMTLEGFGNLIHPDDRAWVLDRMRRRLAGEDVPNQYEYRGLRADGTPWWVEVRSRRIQYRGRPALQATLTDITARKRTEEELRRHEHEFRALVENSPDPISRVDREGRMLYANPALLQVLGLSSGQLLGKQMSSIGVDSPAISTFAAARQQVVATGEELQIEVMFSIDGTPCHYQSRLVPEKDETGQVVSVLAMSRDITARVESERQLQERERFIQAVLDTFPDIVYVYDLVEQRNVYANRELVEILGYSAAAVQAMGAQMIANLLHPDDYPIRDAALSQHQTRSGKEMVELEYRMRHADGAWRWLHSREVPFEFEADGTPRSVLGIAQDVTDRREAERTLREREEQYRTLVENFPNGMVALYGHDLRYVMAGGEGLAQAGMTKESFIGKRLRDMMPPDVYERDEPALLATLLGETTVSEVEYRERFYRVQTTPILDGDGSVVAGMVMTQDLTELHRNRERYRLLTELTFEGILIHEDGYAVEMNDALPQMFGYERDELMGQRLINFLFPPESQAVVDANVQKRYVGPYEVVGLRKDGSTFPVEIEARQITPSLRVAALRDITERRQALQLEIERERSRVMAEFLRNASHEFRTPLAIIQTNLSLLRLETDDVRREALVAKTDDMTNAIERLVEYLVTMSRLDSGLDLHMEDVDVGVLIDLTLRQALKGEQRQLEIDIEAGLPPIHADHDALHRALFEIIHNAVRHTTAQDTISIHAQRGDNAILIHITDTGPGMSAETLERMFERFYREDAAHTTAGFGLGLPIARKVIEAHGGTITASSALGQGAIFVVRLPLT